MMSGTIVCAVEDKIQKTSCENIFEHMCIPMRAKEIIMKRKFLLILE